VNRALRGALYAVRERRPGFRVLAYSLQSNHLHFVIEALPASCRASTTFPDKMIPTAWFDAGGPAAPLSERGSGPRRRLAMHGLLSPDEAPGIEDVTLGTRLRVTSFAHTLRLKPP
jgi:hypothetical protein